jgi:hypothetical protein
MAALIDIVTQQTQLIDANGELNGYFAGSSPCRSYQHSIRDTLRHDSRCSVDCMPAADTSSTQWVKRVTQLLLCLGQNP